MSFVSSSQGFRVGDVIVEPTTNRITSRRATRRVTSREMDVLKCLIDAGTDVVSRETLMDAVWKDVVVNDDALTLAISRLRRAFSDNPRKPAFIETIPTRGYRLLASAEPVHTEAIKDRKNQIRRYRIGLAVLVLLLAIVSTLFVIVRTEYGKVSEVQSTMRVEPV